MQLHDVPTPDKAVAAGGATISALLSMGYMDKVLALIIAALTVALLSLRILIAYREWRQGKRSTD